MQREYLQMLLADFNELEEANKQLKLQKDKDAKTVIVAKESLLVY